MLPAVGYPEGQTNGCGIKRRTRCVLSLPEVHRNTAEWRLIELLREAAADYAFVLDDEMGAQLNTRAESGGADLRV
jgi:hypothetical protein